MGGNTFDCGMFTSNGRFTQQFQEFIPNKAKKKTKNQPVSVVLWVKCLESGQDGFKQIKYAR